MTIGGVTENKDRITVVDTVETNVIIEVGCWVKNDSGSGRVKVIPVAEALDYQHNRDSYILRWNRTAV